MSQLDFHAALLDADRPIPAGLIDPQGRPAGRRFNVYRNNVSVGLTEALRQAFPVVRKLVGDEFFTAMAQEHLRAHQPASPLMMFYGEAMPGFLASFPPVAHLAYLPDIARLELALRTSYHAADVAPVATSSLAELSPDRLAQTRFALAPSLALVRSRWPVHTIWLANMRGAPPPATAESQAVLITRATFDPEPHLLPPGGADVIEALIDGQTIGAAADHINPAHLPTLLGLLIAGNAITDIKTEDS